MRVYISGPITGHANQNRPAFTVARRELQARGFDVVDPHDLHVVGEHDHATFMRVDLDALDACEAIYVLPGWETSAGCLAELHHSRAVGRLVMQHPHSLPVPSARWFTSVLTAAADSLWLDGEPDDEGQADAAPAEPAQWWCKVAPSGLAHYFRAAGDSRPVCKAERQEWVSFPVQFGDKSYGLCGSCSRLRSVDGATVLNW